MAKNSRTLNAISAPTVDVLDEPSHIGGQAVANPDHTQAVSVKKGEAWMPGRDF